MNIQITADDITIEAELYETPTGKAIAEALPMKGTVNRWGGEIYFSIPVSVNLEPDSPLKPLVNHLFKFHRGKDAAEFDDAFVIRIQQNRQRDTARFTENGVEVFGGRVAYQGCIGFDGEDVFLLNQFGNIGLLENIFIHNLAIRTPVGGEFQHNGSIFSD